MKLFNIETDFEYYINYIDYLKFEKRIIEQYIDKLDQKRRKILEQNIHINTQQNKSPLFYELNFKFSDVLLSNISVEEIETVLNIIREKLKHKLMLP